MLGRRGKKGQQTARKVTDEVGGNMETIDNPESIEEMVLSTWQWPQCQMLQTEQIRYRQK